jgi:MarR family transcriptional regulator, organic hydroperoxide resistance regulator
MSSRIDQDVRSVQVAYPRVWFACHVRHARTRDDPAKLTERDVEILGHLDVAGPRSPSGLARHLGVGGPALSAALKRLATRGFVTRAPRAGDRRRSDVLLAPTGLAALARGSPLDAGRVRAALLKLTPADRRRAVDGLALLGAAAAIAERGR